jgi:transcriptional regulator of arginine metabolism
MKSKRQQEILRLIAKYDIDTQEELRAKLAENGFNATQATVSRDMRDLKIIKSSGSDGRYKYVFQEPVNDAKLQTRYAKVLREAVKAVDVAIQLVVVNVYMGMAGAAAVAIDSLALEGVGGSIAGEDTLIVITKDNVSAERVCNFIKEAIK